MRAFSPFSRSAGEQTALAPAKSAPVRSSWSRVKYCGQVSPQTFSPRALARAISAAASSQETWKICTGWSTSSASAMARCVASRSTTGGRDQACCSGSVSPAFSSAWMRQPMASKFSQCTVTKAPSFFAVASTSRN
ncbi:hypothetical protein ACFFMP_20710 [Pseudoroseomonas cervicalis]|uniref:hypothetical protein n=1 Tax=Teichococcus cervicalis TaxID=204525 RepID=UPI0026C9C534